MKKKMFALGMAMCIALSTIFPAMGVTIFDEMSQVKAGTAEYDGYIYLDIERNTLGQSLVLEPTKVGYYTEDNLDDIMKRAFENENIDAGYDGDDTYGYYLTSITDGGEPQGWTQADVPEELKNALAAEEKEIATRSDAEKLQASDYNSYGGWMFSLDDKAPNSGAAIISYNSDDTVADTYRDGSVVRLQFSVYSWGADIFREYKNGWDGKTPNPYITFEYADRDELVKEIAEFHGYKKGEAYIEALKVLEDYHATQAQISDAIEKLENGKDNPASVDFEAALEKTISTMRARATNPMNTSSNGEWAIFSLARYGYEDVLWYNTYYRNLITALDGAGSETLNANKGTENDRAIIAISAIGANASDVAGYNLLKPLANLEYISKQGINGAIYALLALDCKNYDIPENTGSGTQTTREALIDLILSKELEDGGWNFSGNSTLPSDPDLTAMALQALAPYEDIEEVCDAIDQGLECLADMQTEEGSFASYGSATVESTAQVLLALSVLGIDTEKDERFIKEGSSVLDGMMAFYNPATGNFSHTLGGNDNVMGTEQAVYALVAYDRVNKKSNSIYKMTDAKDMYTLDLSDCQIDYNKTEYFYAGTILNPTVTVSYKGITFIAGKNYEVSYPAFEEKNMITDYYKVTGTYGLKGTYSDSYATGKDIRQAVISSIDKQTATGKAITPEVVLKLDGKTLEKDVDYIVSYENNVKVGTATAIITGVGNYRKSLKTSFEITFGGKPELIAVSNTATGINVSWNELYGAEGYYICRKSGNSGYKVVGNVKASQIASDGKFYFADSTAVSGTSYTYTVRAYEGKNLSSYNNAGKTIKFLTEPKVLLANKATGIAISWTKVSGAGGYKVFRKAAGAASWTKIADIKNGSTIIWADKNVSNGIKYVYTVRAYSGNVYSSYSKTGKTLYRQPQNAVKTLSNTSAKTISLSWAKYVSSTGYQVQYSTKSNFAGPTYVTVKSNTILSQKIAGLTKGSTYYVRVRCYKTVAGVNYFGAWSPAKTIKLTK